MLGVKAGLSKPTNDNEVPLEQEAVIYPQAW